MTKIADFKKLKSVQEKLRDKGYFAWYSYEDSTLYVSDKLSDDHAASGAKKNGLILSSVSTDDAAEVTGRQWYGDKVWAFTEEGEDEV